MIPRLYLKILVAVWMAAVIILSFMYAKAADGFPGETSRIMFYHVPQAWIATLSFLLSMLASVFYLKKRQISADYFALTAAELGFLFCILATISGSIFAKATWGSYWNWDPRETSIIILLMIYGAYFALRSAIGEGDRRRVFAAAYAILAFATVPFLIFVIPRISISLHPEDTMNPINPKMDAKFLSVFLASFISYTGLFWWLFILKIRQLKLEDYYQKGLRAWELD